MPKKQATAEYCNCKWSEVVLCFWMGYDFNQTRESTIKSIYTLMGSYGWLVNDLFILIILYYNHRLNSGNPLN